MVDSYEERRAQMFPRLTAAAGGEGSTCIRFVHEILEETHQAA